MRSLTTAAIERMKVPERGQIDHFDKGYPGFAVRCSYGGAKTFIHVYRHHGKLKRRSLGRFPSVTLAEAREAWRRNRNVLEKGEDPTRVAPMPRTFEAVTAEWLKRDQGGNRTAAEVARLIAREAAPAWQGRLIATIKRPDVLSLIDGVVDSGRIPTAQHLHAYLHRLFRWSVGRGYIEQNPLADADKPGKDKIVRRDRKLEDDAELAAVWHATFKIGEAGIEGAAAGWPFGPLIRLLILTAARCSEIGALRWPEIVDNAISLSGDRTKNAEPRLIPLSPASLQLIEALPRIGDSQFVFTTTGERPVSGRSGAKRQLDRLALVDGKPLKPWRLHDFRRTIATRMQKLGIGLQVIEAVLGHISGSRAGIVGVYQQHRFDPEKRAALDAWAVEVERIVSGKSANVIPLRAAHV